MFVEAEGPSSPSWTNLSVPVPPSTGRFLEALSQFVNKVLNPSGEPPSASRPHLQLDLGTMEALPHLWLNLSEKVALEELVRSDDHLVVLFPEDSQAWVEHQAAHWSLEGTLLQQLLEKLHVVIQDLETLPSFRANVGPFRALLASCYYPPGSPENPPNSPGGPSGSPGDSLSVGAPREAQGSPTREKFHSLLLLKALQAVRSHWWESRQASSRAHRRARHPDDYCQLRELTIDLVSVGHIILPNSYNANNCVGPCRSPLSTRVHGSYSHTILLLRMHEQGHQVMRPPCCIPVKYSKKNMISFVPDQGMIIKSYPNMVAESCGCR